MTIREVRSNHPGRGQSDDRPQWVPVEATEIDVAHARWPRGADPAKHRAWLLLETGEVWRWRRGLQFEVDRLRARIGHTDAPLSAGEERALARAEKRARDAT